MKLLRGLFIVVIGGWVVFISAYADSQLSERLHAFAKLPSCGLLQTPCLPTPNVRLYDEGEVGFAAKLRTNEQYGLPGWTRDQGTRFHKGVDILPIHFEKTDKTVRIDYYNPETEHSFSKDEPVLIPKDEVYSILDGIVVVANKDEKRSGYGCYIMIQHQFADGKPFISMYAHLDKLEVKKGDTVSLGDLIGWMGRTSSDAGARNYLKAIPHCHFEVGKVIDPDFADTKEAKALYPRILGGKYDPRNIQPYHPIQFLQHFHAQPKSSFATKEIASPLKEK